MVTKEKPAPELRALAQAAAGYSCTVERALAIVGAKWTLVILHNLMDRPRRFGELQRLIVKASPKMLTARLRELEQLGLVTRTVYPEIPPRVEYALTEEGRTVWPIVDSLDRWGKKLRPARRT
jgi:DNA-binding HxlR family transcriptional regulator